MYVRTNVQYINISAGIIIYLLIYITLLVHYLFIQKHRKFFNDFEYQILLQVIQNPRSLILFLNTKKKLICQK